MSDFPFSEEIVPHSHFICPLVPSEAVSYSPDPWRPAPPLPHPPFRLVVQHDKVASEPPFVQTEQSQLPQPLV